MEVHSPESSSKLNATVSRGAAATAASVAGEVTKHVENESNNGSGGDPAAFSILHSNGEDPKVKATESSTSRPDVFPYQDRIMLLEDSTADTMPSYSKEIFTSIDPKRIPQVDVLMMLIYCVALESGYAAIEATESTELESVYWGSSFHARNIHKLAKIPVRFRDDNDNYVLKLLVFHDITDCNEFRLCGVQCGDLFVVTLTPENGTHGISVCLSIPRYVLGSMKSPKIAARLQNLKELSYLLKDRLFVPARIVSHESFGIDHLYLGLNGIPQEILIVVAKKLRMKDIQNLSKTCKKMRYFCLDYRESYWN